MAYGFRHVPKQRTAGPRADYCAHCGARLDVGMQPHFCKESSPGTLLTVTPFIPFR